MAVAVGVTVVLATIGVTINLRAHQQTNKGATGVAMLRHMRRYGLRKIIPIQTDTFGIAVAPLFIVQVNVR